MDFSQTHQVSMNSPRTPMALVTGISLALAISTAQAQSAHSRKIDLSFHWIEGTTSRFRVQEDMVQEVSGESSSTLQWHREFTYTERVLKANSESGSATIERTIETVLIEVKGDNIESASYDSTAPDSQSDKSNPFIAPFANMQGQIIRFSIDSGGRVTDLDGAVDLWGAVLNGFAEVGGGALSGALAKSEPSNEAMRRQIEAGLRLIPNRPVRFRETWQQRLPHATPIGTLTSEMDHTLSKFQRRRGRQAGKLALIETHGTLTAGDTTQELGSVTGSLATLMSLAGIQVNLGESKIEGETLFDTERGRIVRQELNMTTEWSTKVDAIAGFEDLGISGEGHQRMTQRSTLERID